MTLPPISALLAVLFCAALFVLMFQYIFPRPAPWKLVGAALAAGIVCTIALTQILRQFVPPGLSGLEELTSFSAALPFAVFRIGLPEEGAKALGAILALLPFWRRATPPAAFQAAMMAAIGFAIVENAGYAKAFGEHAMLMAFGRGFLATLIHTLVAMIFGAFLMRFVARGWRHWHLLVIGYLVAAGCHALYDAGLLPVLSEYLRTKTVDPVNVLSALPLIIGGIGLGLVAGFWSLRRAIRRAACDDLITTEASHRAAVRRWRWSGNGLLLIGLLGLIAAVAWGTAAEPPQSLTPDMETALLTAIGFGGTVFLIILGWLARQKR